MHYDRTRMKRIDETADDAVTSARVAFEALVLGLPHTSKSHMTAEELKDFDVGIAMFITRVEALKRRAMDHILCLSRARNASAPINQLPPEVLQHVFLIFKLRDDDSFHGLSYRNLCSLMLVCRGWHDLIKDYPLLWAHISVGLPQVALATLLERSKQCGLTIGDDWEHQPQPGGRTAFLTAVAEHVHHWRDCQIVVVEPQQDQLQPIEHSAAPMLQRLSLTCSVENTTPFDLFQGEAPLLMELYLRRAAILWDSPIFSHLTILYIESLSSPHCPSIHQIFHMLETLPLCEFQLSELDIASSDEMTLPPQPTVLSSMKCFSLVDIPLRSTNFLLHAFELPPCELLIRISETGGRLLDTQQDRGLRKVLGWLMRWEGKIRVDTSESQLELWFPGDETGHCLFLTGSDWGASNDMLLLWILENLGPRFSERIHELDLYAEANWGHRAADILGHVQNLSSLWLKDINDHLGSVWHTLAVPHADESSGSLTWSSPDLDFISLENCGLVDEEALVNMVRCRHGQIIPPMQTTNYPLPAPLRDLYLTMTPITPTSRENLRDLLIGGTFDYYGSDSESGTSMVE